MMLVAMAATTAFTISALVLMHLANTPHGHKDPYAGRKDPMQNQCLVGDILDRAPACQPRPQMVRLPEPTDPAFVAVIPSQVEVRVCSGSCSEGNVHHTCVPTPGATTNWTLEVLLRSSDGSGFICSTIQMQNHSSCYCGCPVEKSSCADYQEFDDFMCKCRCKNEMDRMNCWRQSKGRKFWDELSCRCLCNPEEYRECSTGFIYDAYDTCECIGETLTNLAGAEVLAPIAILLLLSIFAVILLGLKLWRVQQHSSRRNAPGGEETQAFRPPDTD